MIIATKFNGLNSLAQSLKLPSERADAVLITYDYCDDIGLKRRVNISTMQFTYRSERNVINIIFQTITSVSIEDENK